MTYSSTKECEGGCGVIGIACQKKIAGKHLLQSLYQMRNRGNGKGGGIAAVGLDPHFFNTTEDVLENTTLYAIAYLDLTSKEEVEKNFIHPFFEVIHTLQVPHIENYQELQLEIKPPEVIVYFVKCKAQFSKEEEEEFIYQNSYQLNCQFYVADGEKKAFVLSHANNLLVLKMVGYGDDVIKYYKLENLKAHVWIGHHRYPTKGKVWHPGGAHPFIGVNEALVHNGDFSNYYSIVEYLSQKNIHPHFLTDTEVAALLFDYFYRTLKYPLEYVIEAFAPTTERDFTLLPQDKAKIYHLLQKTHMHASPDGPWFFLIAQSEKKAYRLIGITDTSMLRPQVFALQQGVNGIGFAASEKQAIDAALVSLSKEDDQFWECADIYWNARGGSHTDGGAFSFTVVKEEGEVILKTENKFGDKIEIQNTSYPFKEVQNSLNLTYLTQLLNQSKQSIEKAKINNAITDLLKTHQEMDGKLILNGHQFDVEGNNSLARHIVKKYKQGFKRFILFNLRGHRFIGNGLASNSYGVEIDVYGSSGDYLASGIDGATIRVHGSAQDQLAQIMLDGLLIVHGDVGQTFMYGAKGGTAFIKGNTAGRALINAVGNPRVIINGTSLDYLAESFMAGNPLQRGGFVIINGLHEMKDLETPYAGNNLFSLASGGAIYIRDPKGAVRENQLNGGKFVELTDEDWKLIYPYLHENEEIFNIPISRLLEFNGKFLPYYQVYRKVITTHAHPKQAEEVWVKVHDR